MRTRYHRSNLLTAMLALACLPGLSVPPPRKEVDLAEAEAVANDLHAAGILATDLAGEVGAERFGEMGRAILEVHRAMQATGETLTDVRKLLAIVRLKQVRETGHLLAGAVTAGAGLDYEALAFPGRQRVASFGEPVDSRDLGALPSLFDQKYAAMQAQIDRETAAAFQQRRREEGDFTPPDVAQRAMDALVSRGMPRDHFHTARVEPVFPDSPLDYLHQPGVYVGIDMAVDKPLYNPPHALVREFASMARAVEPVVEAMGKLGEAASAAFKPALGLVPIRDREAQRAARKVRSKVKARRGY